MTADAAASVEREGIVVERATEDDLDRWNDRVDASDQGTPFHRREALDVLADHSGATLHPLVGRKGQEPVGVFPVFELSKGPVNLAFSPPPNLWVAYLGPALLNLDKLKYRKAERRHRRFVDASLDWIDREIDPKYTLVRTPPRYDDPRPFAWREFDVDPRHTYVLPVEGPEDDLLMSFSSDLRQNVRKPATDAYAIETGGPDAIRRIVEHVRRRHVEQDMTYGVDPSFVIDLHDRLPDDRVTAYVCRVDGDYASGVVTVQDADRVARWQGGARPADGIDVPVNDLLDWRIVRDALAAGRTRYDLVGANERRLCGYKAKFAPDLATYYEFQAGTRYMRAAASLYGRFK